MSEHQGLLLMVVVVTYKYISQCTLHGTGYCQFTLAQASVCHMRQQLGGDTYYANDISHMHRAKK